MIDFDLFTRSANLLKPKKLVYENDNNNIDFNVYTKWKAKMSLHRAVMTKYEKQRKVFKQLIKQIQSSIFTDVVVLIENEFSHSYDLLRTLKLRFASTDQNKKIKIKTQYRELCKKSKNQNLNKWLNAWKKTYITDKTLNVYEMIKKRSIRDFIYSIMKINKIWTNAHLALIDEEIKKDSLFNLITKFRNHTRMKSNKKLHQSNHSTFFVSTKSDQGRKSENVSFQNKSQSQKCLCDEMHWWIDCTYLNSFKRSYEWQTDSETVKRVNEAMKNSDTKKYVENAIKRAMKKRNQYSHINQINQNQTFETSNAFTTDQTASGPYYEVFTTIIAPSFFIATDYSLQSFWILNNESKTHICNKNMLHRFRKTRNASSEAVLTDETRSKIEAIEKIEISINAFERKIWKVLFIEICYISNFLTNIAASRKFRAKKIYFDDQGMRLYANEKTLGLVSDLNDHDVLKHQVMEYASHQVMKHASHASNQISKRSTSEKVQMKNERSISEKMEMMEVKKLVQINRSKQTDSRVSDKIKNEKKKAYQRAENTQSHDRIKFTSFDFISSSWLKHKKKSTSNRFRTLT